MPLSNHDLSQLDSDYLDDLPEGELRTLSKQLLTDLKEVRERLNQTPETSSCPPSSREPWKVRATIEGDTQEDGSAADESLSPNMALLAATHESACRTKKAGRRVGSEGYSRNLTLAVTQTRYHHPACCGQCGQAFANDTDFRSWNARYELELDEGSAESPGYTSNTSCTTTWRRPVAADMNPVPSLVVVRRKAAGR